MPKQPCDASELVHFRNRIGEEGMELILAESIRVNTDHDDEDHFDTAFIDSTVQEKNITYPTDAKLHKKIIKNVLKIVHDKCLPLRQSYTRTLKGIYRSQRFRNHPKNRLAKRWNTPIRCWQTRQSAAKMPLTRNFCAAKCCASWGGLTKPSACLPRCKKIPK